MTSEQPRTWSGLWLGLTWYIIGFGIVLLSQFLAASIVALVDGNGVWAVRGLLGDGDVLSLSFFLALPLLLLLLYPWIVYWHRRPPVAYLAIEPVALKRLVAWLGIMAGALVVYVVVGTVMDRPRFPDWILDTWRTVDNVTAFVLAVAVLGPVLEEVLCRGYVLKAFADSKLGPVWGSILVSGLWAVVHFQYDVFDVAWIFLLGLLLCAARLVTGSLVTPILLHGMWNFMSVLAVFFYLT